MVATHLRSSSLVLTSLVAASCGGGGGGEAVKGNAAAITATFPAAHCVTTGDQLTVRGTSADPSRIGAILVGNKKASSSDQFATWSARVAVPPGTTTLSVVPFDRSGAKLPSLDLTVDFETVPSTPIRLALDPTRQQVLVGVGSEEPFGAVALDLAEGRWIEVSGPNRGSGPGSSRYSGFAIDPTIDTAWGFTRFPTRIVQIDLATGQRKMLSDETSAGPAFGAPDDIDVDSANGRLLMPDTNLEALVAVDLDDGSRAIFSDATHGTGPEFDLPEGVVVVATQGRALVVDGVLGALFSVDLATGDRSIVSDETRGAGPTLRFPISVSFDPASGDALVLDSALDVLLRVDLVTGDRAIITDATHGGAKFETLRAVAARLDPSGRALVADSAAGRILAVDLVTGVREDLGRIHVGEATPLGSLFNLKVDVVTGHLLVAKSFDDAALIDVDPTTGRRTLVSSATRGSGPLHDFSLALAVAPTLRRAYIGDSSGLLEVDLATGDRTRISGGGVGSGPDLDFIQWVAIDEERGQALVVDEFSDDAELLSVDLATGDRTEVSGPNRGNGDLFACPQAVVLDPDGITAYVSDRCQTALVRVDRVSGDREVVSSGAIGGGPPFVIMQQGLSLDADGGHVFVTDLSLGIVRVDLVTGDRVVVSGPGVGHGSPVESLGEFDPVRGRFFARPRNGVSILSIDLESGDRVMISY